jgi:aminoglycoside phosphotransferase (APT) family kinase protein
VRRPIARRLALLGDLRITHVFVDGDEATGVIDWSEAAPGDATDAGSLGIKAGATPQPGLSFDTDLVRRAGGVITAHEQVA